MAHVRIAFKKPQSASNCTNPKLTMTGVYETLDWTLNGTTLTTGSAYEGSGTVSNMSSLYRLFVNSGHGYTVAKTKIYYSKNINTPLVDVTTTGVFTIMSTVIDVDLDKLSVSWGSGSSDYNHFIIDFAYVAPAIPRTITETLIGCTSSNLESSVMEGTTKSITYTPISGKKIVSITHNNPLNVSTTINASRTSGSISFTADKDVTITATNLLDQKVIISGTFTNCTCNYSNNASIDVAKNIVITAEAGYEFKGVFTFKYDGGVTQALSNDTTTLTINTSANQMGDANILLNIPYKASKIVEAISGFVNLYKVSTSELSALAEVRFGSIEGESIDYGQFISNLYILPFSLPEYVIGDRTDIILGQFDSNVESSQLTTYIYEVDAGSIYTPPKYNNMYDFINTECWLNIPFVGRILLPTEQVVGQTIGIQFSVDLYSGNVMFRVSSSFSSYKTIATADALTGTPIPFMSKTNDSVVGSVSNIYDNKIDICYIEVIRNIPYTKDANIFGSATVEYGMLSTYDGYLQCSDLDMVSSATSKEQEEIKSLLSQGVFV